MQVSFGKKVAECCICRKGLDAGKEGVLVQEN